jgi:hypothetical protein
MSLLMTMMMRAVWEVEVKVTKVCNQAGTWEASGLMVHGIP